MSVIEDSKRSIIQKQLNNNRYCDPHVVLMATNTSEDNGGKKKNCECSKVDKIMWVVFAIFIAILGVAIYLIHSSESASPSASHCPVCPATPCECNCPSCQTNETDLKTLKKILRKNEKKLEEVNRSKEILEERLSAVRRELDLTTRFFNWTENIVELRQDDWKGREGYLRDQIDAMDKAMKAKDGELHITKQYFDHLANAIVQYTPQEECEGFICKVLDAAKEYWSKRPGQNEENTA